MFFSSVKMTGYLSIHHYVRKGKTMTLKAIFTKKRIIAAACVLLAAVIFTAGFLGGSGIGSSNRTASDAPSGSGSYPLMLDYGVLPDYEASNTWKASAEESAGLGGITAPSESELTTIGTTAQKNTKLIYTARISLQSTEFETTRQSVRSLVAGCGGYMENESLSNGSVSSSALRTASFVVRVPAEHYEELIRGIGTDCRIVSMEQSMTDVAEQYFDTEQKLETLRNKHDRLEELLGKAAELSDIIVLENELSETEYQINRYQGTLNKYDSLVNFSTVNISLREVSRPGSAIDDDQGFGAKLARAFTDGLARTADGLKNVAYWVSYNIVGEVIAAAVVIVLIKVRPIKKIKARKNRKAESAAEETAKA